MSYHQMLGAKDNEMGMRETYMTTLRHEASASSREDHDKAEQSRAANHEDKMHRHSKRQQAMVRQASAWRKSSASLSASTGASMADEEQRPIGRQKSSVPLLASPNEPAAENSVHAQREIDSNASDL